MKKIILAIVIVLICSGTIVNASVHHRHRVKHLHTIHRKESFNWDRFLSALRKRETGGQKNGGVGAHGDHGHALGPYQIWHKYWSDAIEYRPEIGGCYEDVRGKAYSEKIIKAYLDRYVKHKTYERCARVHNGGPNGYKSRATLQYWILLRSYLEQ